MLADQPARIAPVTAGFRAKTRRVSRVKFRQILGVENFVGALERPRDETAADVRPDFVHIMLDGRIVREGGSELADELEDKGYEWVREEVAAGAS